MHNSKYQCHMASMLHIPPTNLLLLAARRESYKTAYLFTKILKNFLEKVQENASRQKTRKSERVSGLAEKQKRR